MRDRDRDSVCAREVLKREPRSFQVMAREGAAEENQDIAVGACPRRTWGVLPGPGGLIGSNRPLPWRTASTGWGL